MKLPELKYNADGLLPAIIQDASSGKVLMLGYMSPASIEKTLETGLVTFFSRSRQTLWTKGETSGNTLSLRSVAYDCDGDALLIRAEASGPTCHTGEESCFYRELLAADESNLNDTLFSLEKVIATRKRDLPEGSYTTYLFDKGLDKILKKVGEEAAEVIIAAKNTDQGEVIAESADLLYHLLVLLREKEIPLSRVMEKLEERKK